MSEVTRIERGRIIGRVLFLGLLLLTFSACGAKTPTSPPAVTRTVTSLDLVCSPSLMVGQSGLCFAQAHYSDGSTVNPASANWTSSDTSIASIVTYPGFGRIYGRGAGQAVMTAQLEGGTATTVVPVRAEDFVNITGELIQGLFQIGRTLTFYTVGEYGVASADTAQLNVEINDQNGKSLIAGGPKTVSRGGDSFVFTNTFVVSPGTTQVCRTAVLQIGAKRLVDPGATGLLSCVNVVQ